MASCRRLSYRESGGIGRRANFQNIWYERRRGSSPPFSQFLTVLSLWRIDFASAGPLASVRQCANPQKGPLTRVTVLTF